MEAGLRLRVPGAPAACHESVNPRRHVLVHLVKAAAQLERGASQADELYTPGRPLPQRLIGPVAVVHMEGKGRGVVATQPIAAGELIMLVPCLGMVTSPTEQQPSPKQLLDRLEVAAPDSPWWDILYAGTSRSTKKLPDLQQPTLEASSSSSSSGGGSTAASEAVAAGSQAPEDPEASGGSSSSSSDSSRKKGAGGFTVRRKQGQASSKKGDKPSPAQKAAGRQMAKVVALNAYGEPHSDYAVAKLLLQGTGGFVGLWPEFSCLNHSCSPNTTHWVLRSHMVVRAVQDIAPGQEVTVSYLGRPQLTPWRPRTQLLQEQYGFTCACPRCQGEEACYERVGDQLEEVQEVVAKELEPAAAAAGGAGNWEALQEVQLEAQGLLLNTYTSFRRTMVSPQQRLWCLASISSCLELVANTQLSLADSPANDPAAMVASLQALLRPLESVTLGSDLHAITAAQLAQATGLLHGEGSGEHAAAVRQCRAAQRLRYGPVSDGLADQLAQLNRTLY